MSAETDIATLLQHARLYSPTSGHGRAPFPRLGELLDSVEVPVGDIELGNKVYMLSHHGDWKAYPVVGFGQPEFNRISAWAAEWHSDSSVQGSNVQVALAVPRLRLQSSNESKNSARE